MVSLNTYRHSLDWMKTLMEITLYWLCILKTKKNHTRFLNWVYNSNYTANIVDIKIILYNRKTDLFSNAQQPILLISLSGIIFTNTWRRFLFCNWLLSWSQSILKIKKYIKTLYNRWSIPYSFNLVWNGRKSIHTELHKIFSWTEILQVKG